jgi:hypothetical protein
MRLTLIDATESAATSALWMMIPPLLGTCMKQMGWFVNLMQFTLQARELP